MRSKEKDYKAAYWVKWAAKNRPPKQKACEKCVAMFAPRGPQKRCHECRQLVCDCCGVKFIPSNSTLKHRFCSVACRAKTQSGIEPSWLAANRGRKPRTFHLSSRNKYGNALDRDWRKAIFERDAYTCQKCGVKGGRLQAHHIQPFKAYPELRWDTRNGKTLCVECHKRTHTYGWSNYWYSKRRIAKQRLAQEVLAL